MDIFLQLQLLSIYSISILNCRNLQMIQLNDKIQNIQYPIMYILYLNYRINERQRVCVTLIYITAEISKSPNLTIKWMIFEIFNIHWIQSILLMLLYSLIYNSCNIPIGISRISCLQLNPCCISKLGVKTVEVDKAAFVQSNGSLLKHLLLIF